ncbi:MAG: class I SAM-dependent methyltransferase, partial [Methanobrevibacter sp.]|nr:class I SAM-dependent methyltransferase [Candidatus Methanoflexus mossambicus]
MFNKLFDFISNQFSNPHGFFGKISTFIMNKLNKKQYKFILDNIKIENGDIILDIGFGNGYLIKKLISNNSNNSNNSKSFKSFKSYESFKNSKNSKSKSFKDSKNLKKIYGIDISQDMVNQTKQKFKKEIIDNKIDLKIGDVKDLDFENNYFNKIYTVNTIYFWNDLEKSFSEIYRTLNNGGIFLNVIYSKEWLSKLKVTDNYF